jgi:hypothetical protein
VTERAKAEVAAGVTAASGCNGRRCEGRAGSGWLVLGEVVAVYIDKALIKDGVYQTALANPIGAGITSR